MDRILRNDRFHRFSAFNPTIGTGVDMGVVAAFDATKALVSVVNPATSPYWLVLEWLRLRATAVDTSSTDFQVSGVLDPTDRTGAPPGGDALSPVEHAFTTAQTTPALVRLGAVTPVAAAAGAARLFGHLLKAAKVAIADEWRFDFDQLRPGGIPSGPVVLRPGASFLLHAWGTAMAADAPDFEAHLACRQVVKRNDIA